MIKIILAEDHTIVRKGIRMILENKKEFQIVGEKESGLGVLDLLLSGVKADIIITDVEMPDLDGLELLKAIIELEIPTRVIMFSMHASRDYIFQSFKNGASAYLLKTIKPSEMVFAIKHVHSGFKYLSTGLSSKLIDLYSTYSISKPEFNPERFDLSPKQIEILYFMADGFTSNEISEKLQISKRTVEVERKSLIFKIGVKNTASLIRFMVRDGMVRSNIFC